MGELPDEQSQRLRELWVRREQLIEMLVMEQNRLEHASLALHRRLCAHIDYLRMELKKPAGLISLALQRRSVKQAAILICQEWLAPSAPALLGATVAISNNIAV